MMRSCSHVMLDDMVNRLNEPLFRRDLTFHRVTRARTETSGHNKFSYSLAIAGEGTDMASPNILVVEDDRETRALIAKYLTANACNVTTASDGREMEKVLADRRVDLLILDLMLPGEDGLSLCRKVRANSQLPIIMLTARGEDVDRILGLEMGADDYLAKPFNPRELLARINAVLRRHAASLMSSTTNGASSLAFLEWHIDFRARELRNPAGARVAMTSAEFDLLRIFCERPGRIMSRESLLDLTQGRNAGSLERSIDVLVSRIRRKIESDPQDAKIIKTVRSGGYVFTPTVTAMAPTAKPGS
jgi:two-component system OmpR family response regulator